MKQLLIAVFAVFSLSVLIAKADTLVSVPNGQGTYRASDQSMFFYDSLGNYIWLGGSGHFVVIYYPDGTSAEFQGYDGATFQGIDEAGNSYTATVHETLATRKAYGSGRGGGYRSTVTYVAGGEIDYLYQ